MRAIGIISLVIISATAVYGCSSDDAYAQGGYEHYAGRRVFIQSLVYDLRDPKYFGDVGAGSVHIRARAAAPLTIVEPRVNDSLSGISAIKANATRIDTARTRVDSDTTKAINTFAGAKEEPAYIKKDVNVGQELAWDYVWLAGNHLDRNYCDVQLNNLGGYPVEGSAISALTEERARFYYRYSTQDCRTRPPITLTGGSAANSGVNANLDFSRPSISLSWIDRYRNKGDYVIGGFEVIYPAPTIKEIEGFRVKAPPADEGQEFLDPRTVCDFTRIRILSLGIQSAKPEDEDAHKGLAGLDDDADYFDGKAGRRIAGQVSSCVLDAPRNLEVILAPMDVFISEELYSDYNMKLRTVVETASKDKIDHSAKLIIEDGNASGDEALVEITFAEDDSDDDYLPIKTSNDSSILYPSVKFNIDGSKLNYLEKPEGRPDAPDIGRIDMHIEYTHAITIERPPLILTEKISATPLCFWQSCDIDGRGNTRCGSGDSCKSRCSRRCSGNRDQWYPPSEATSIKYFGEHERIDADALKHKAGDADAEVTYTFSRKVHFEPIFVTFGEPYEELIYVRPTPAAIFGDRKRQVYWRIGDVIGLRNGEDVRCLEDVDSPWTHVDGKGCRLEVACCIQAPVEEDACGDEISDAEFNCPLLPADERFFSDDDKPADPDDDPDTS